MSIFRGAPDLGSGTPCLWSLLYWWFFTTSTTWEVLWLLIPSSKSTGIFFSFWLTRMQLSSRVFKFNLFSLHWTSWLGKPNQTSLHPLTAQASLRLHARGLGVYSFLAWKALLSSLLRHHRSPYSFFKFLIKMCFSIPQKNPYVELILPFSDCPHYLFTHYSIFIEIISILKH